MHVLETEPSHGMRPQAMSHDCMMEPRTDRLTAEMNQRPVKAQLRLEIWRRLNQITRSHTEKLLSDLVRNKFQKKPLLICNDISVL